MTNHHAINEPTDGFVLEDIADEIDCLLDSFKWLLE